MKTLKSTFFLCLMSCILCQKINAQIVYTDVFPDDTLKNASDTFNIDLNNDGASDYFFFHIFYYSIPCTFHPGSLDNRALVSNIGSNSFFGIDTIYPLALNSNVLINNNLNFTAGVAILKRNYRHSCFPYPLSSGNWITTGDHYLPVKLIIGGNNYFGWIRLQIPIGTYSISIVVKDFAYNSIPNQPILAGETICTTPRVNLTQSGSLSFCAGDSVVLTANGTGYQYQWKKGGINISGATKQTYVAKIAGIYKCKVTNSCGSLLSVGKTVTVPCKISNDNIVEALEHLSIYPNPATNSVTIKFPSDEPGEIQIVNLFGQVVFSEKINQEQTSIDVSKFSEGMYIGRWSSGETNETKIFSVIK